MPEKKRTWTKIAAAIALAAFLLDIIVPVIESTEFGPLLFMTIMFVLPVLFILGSMVRYSESEGDSPDDQFRREQYRVARTCSELILQFLAFAHPIIAEQNRLLTESEVSSIPTSTGKIWALTDEPPEVFIYALGATYHRAGKYNESFSLLNRLIYSEDSSESNSGLGLKLAGYLLDEAFESQVSLMRYQGNAESPEYRAVKFFEANCRTNAMRLLADSRRQLHGSLLASIKSTDALDQQGPIPPDALRSGEARNHESISEVLHRVYDSP